MASDRPSLVNTLRKPTPDPRDAFVAGEDEAQQLPPAQPTPVEQEKPSRTQVTFRLKDRNHKRLKKLASLVNREMLDIAEEALERRMEELIDENGLRDVFTKLNI